jgi:hypothetical protein
MSLNAIYNLNADPLAQLSGSGNSIVYLPAYATSLALDPTQGALCQVITTAAGNSTFTASSLGKFGQNWTIEVANDAGGARTITFSTGFRATATVVGTASKSILVEFVSDGTVWKESGRSAAAV